ncbi:MAG: DUF177 domain-containing protein [Sneathiella sp.]|nr:DUF177 domain-containing protein [Sneathiella sp.]
MKEAGGGFTRLINVERAGRDAIQFDVEATEEECRALAERLDILGVSDVRAVGSLARQDASGQIALTAHLTANAVQACVVTLEPVPQEIDVEFTVFYTFDKDDLADDEEVEKVIGLEDEDPPELIVNNRINLADMISEQIALALEPYPRSRNLSDDEQPEGVDTAADDKSHEVHRPFANLRDLMSKK